MFPLIRYATSTVMLAIVCSIGAQETRNTVTNPSPNPKDDARPNSKDVPDVYSINSQFEKVVVIRLKPRTDLLQGLTNEVKAQHIQNGVILSAIGSLRSYSVHQVTNRDLPTQDTIERNPTQPVDLVSMNGYVIEGRLHPHMTVATPDRVIAGHVEEGNEVYTYAIVTIGVLHGASLARIDDKGYR